MRMVVRTWSVAAVIPSTIVLLLGQFPDDSLQLFAGLLLVLEELLHPFILLQKAQTRAPLTGDDTVPVCETSAGAHW